jgi:hypothetical protein
VRGEQKGREGKESKKNSSKPTNKKAQAPSFLILSGPTPHHGNQ